MAEAGVPTLEMRRISKTFPGVKALNGVQLKAWGGEVQALMGENGAGKSTLMKILSGAYQADAGGEILIDGEVVQITDPIAAKRAGIAIIYQELSLAPNLSVAENIHLGDEIHKKGLIDRKAMYDGCRPVLERLGAPFRPETNVGTLSIAERQLVEIARALHAKSKILVLDEPRGRLYVFTRFDNSISVVDTGTISAVVVCVVGGAVLSVAALVVLRLIGGPDPRRALRSLGGDPGRVLGSGVGNP